MEVLLKNVYMSIMIPKVFPKNTENNGNFHYHFNKGHPMATLAIKNELLYQVKRLPVDMQLQVLQFARALEISTHVPSSGSSMLSFAGTIPQADLDVMAKAIHDGCERVDADEW